MTLRTVVFMLNELCILLIKRLIMVFFIIIKRFINIIIK